MIWAIWREIYRQDLCLSFNQWLLRVISVNRCLIFKVHHPLLNRLSRAVSQVSFAIIPNRPPFCQHLFSIFFPFLLPLLQLLRVLLLSAFFFIWFLSFHVVVILISCTIYSFSLPFLLFVDISWFCFLWFYFYFLCSFFLVICIFISFLSN